MLYKKPSFYLAIAGLVGMGLLLKETRKTPPRPPPLVEPARSPFANSVAASGIIEAARENVKIAAPKAGLVEKVLVQIGSTVKSGGALLQLDSREALAKIETMQSQLAALQAALNVDEVQVTDLADQFDRVSRLERNKVASEDELKRKEFLLRTLEARVLKAKADLKAAQSQLRQAQVELEVLTVRTPRDGTILQVNIREGEFASVNSPEPLMILGEVGKLQVRADVDEQNAPLVVTNQPAAAFLKGSTENRIALRFVRIDPFVIPKRSLTGDSTERVDTRVLQIIFEFDPPSFPIYVGQQVDVFIERPAAALQ